MTGGPSASSRPLIGPTWLIDDLLRVEGLLLAAANESNDAVVAEASTHLVRAGGKRLRPALVLLASRAGNSGERATDLAAAAVELVHLATLYHDDVIDKTDTRRGVPTVHSKWGVEVAVLSGDYLFARGCALGAEAGGEVPGILARAIGKVCEGQIVETTALGDPTRSPDDYLSTIGRKTAALFGAACDLGCATSDASADHRSSLAGYGASVGMAFQIIDDLLDLVGDPAVTGKAPGTDLVQGVFTLPVLIACERDPALVRSLSNGERSVDALLPAFVKSGALAETYDTAASFGRAAVESLDALPDEEWRQHLSTIVTGVLAQVNL